MRRCFYTWFSHILFAPLWEHDRWKDADWASKQLRRLQTSKQECKECKVNVKYSENMFFCKSFTKKEMHPEHLDGVQAYTHHVLLSNTECKLDIKN